MIPVKEVAPGVFERLSGNPVMLRLDGEAKCGLRAMLKSHWTDAERAEYGVYLVHEASIPEGKMEVGPPTYVRENGVLVEKLTLTDKPIPPVRQPTNLDLLISRVTTLELKVAELESKNG